MDIHRQIEVYDNQTEKLVQKLIIDSFDLEIFKKRFEIKKDDSQMYELYEINFTTADLFPKIKFDFEKYSYYVTSYQI